MFAFLLTKKSCEEQPRRRRRRSSSRLAFRIRKENLKKEIKTLLNKEIEKIILEKMKNSSN